MQLLSLSQIQPSDRLLVGDEVIALSQLKQMGFPVLECFIINSDYFTHLLSILDHSNSLLQDFPDSSLYLNVDDYKTLQLVAQESRQAILEIALPTDWIQTLGEAVRSLNTSQVMISPSLAISSLNSQTWQGVLPSQISSIDPMGLELALKKTWGEFFRAKSLIFWKKMDIKLEKVRLALLIQPISNAIASGNTVITPETLQIQSTWGLQESLHKGEVLPDSYQINLLSGELESQQLGYKSLAYRLNAESTPDCLESYPLDATAQENYSLTESNLQELIEILTHLGLEKAYHGYVEWSFGIIDPDQPPKFYFTQSYPDFSQQLALASKPVMEKTKPLLTGISAAPGRVTAPILIISELDSVLLPLPQGRILVTPQITPPWIPWLKEAVGIITEQGGITSHGAILARELGLPAIVGAKNATKILKNDENVILDGDRGAVYPVTSSSPPLISPTPVTPSLSFPPLGTKIMVNLSQPDSLEKVQDLPLDGVGLLRSELMLLDLLKTQSLTHWLEETHRQEFVTQLTELIRQFSEAFAPRPVFYRSLDWQFKESVDFNDERLLGHRGTSSYLLNSLLFDLELQAITQLYQQGQTNINLILPFVRRVEEFKFCRDRVEKAGLSQFNPFKLWIMAEVPSVIFQLVEYIEAGVQGIAIGTNDLTQLLLGVDRDEAQLQDCFNPCHPAMLAALKQLITTANQGGIPCSICGQAPVNHPELVDYLVEWGITAISVESEAVERTYQAIARAETRLLLKLARQEKGIINF